MIGDGGSDLPAIAIPQRDPQPDTHARRRPIQLGLVTREQVEGGKDLFSSDLRSSLRFFDRGSGSEQIGIVRPQTLGQIGRQLDRPGTLQGLGDRVSFGQPVVAEQNQRDPDRYQRAFRIDDVTAAGEPLRSGFHGLQR